MANYVQDVIDDSVIPDDDKESIVKNYIQNQKNKIKLLRDNIKSNSSPSKNYAALTDDSVELSKKILKEAKSFYKWSLNNINTSDTTDNTNNISSDCSSVSLEDKGIDTEPVSASLESIGVNTDPISVEDKGVNIVLKASLSKYALLILILITIIFSFYKLYIFLFKDKNERNF